MCAGRLLAPCAVDGREREGLLGATSLGMWLYEPGGSPRLGGGGGGGVTP